MKMMDGLSSEESGFSDEQFLLNEEWDSRNVNYYMGTKKDLLSFLDDEEKRRRSSGKERLRHHCHQNSNQSSRKRITAHLPITLKDSF